MQRAIATHLGRLLQTHLVLEWEYRDPAAADTLALDLDTALITPPSEELGALYELARFGNMHGIRERAARLEARNLQLAPFARKLAQGYQERAIMALLEPHRAMEVGQ